MGRHRRFWSALLLFLAVGSTVAAWANVGDIRTNRTPFSNGIPPLTIFWNPPFPDTNYTAVCTAEDIPDDALLPVITSRTAASMTVVPTDSGFGGVLDCMAVPDSDLTTIRHARTTFVGDPLTITATWNQAFANNNYTAVCTGETSNPQNIDFTGAINVVRPASLTFANGGLVAGTLHCIAILDTDPGQVRHGTAVFSNGPLTVQVPWTQPFSDSNYAAVCSNVAPPGSGAGSAITILANSKQSGSITTIPQLDSGTADCIGGANSQFGTSITLTLSPPSPVTVGQVVSLQATVISQFGDNVPIGTVTFFSGNQVLGTVQANDSSGATAILNTRFGPGIYSLTAQYNNNNIFSASLSMPQPLTVTGTEPTISTLMATPDGSNYDFLLSVFGFGFAPLAGSATLNNLTAGGTLLGNITLAGPGLLGFQSANTYGTGIFPAAIVTGDFNGDGLPDLALVNQVDNTVSVLLGNGDGTFRSQQTFPVGNNPQGIAIGDFNSDGILDLAVASESVGVGVLMGNGDGTFQPQQVYQAGNGPNAVAVGDFDLDGTPDLVVTDFLGASVVVLLNNSTGTFTAQMPFSAGNQPVAITVGDFNRDGNLDVAVADSQNQAMVLLGDGAGGFGTPQAYPVGSAPRAIVTGDLNGDGILDLALTNQDDNTVSILLGNGDGTFQPQQVFAAGQSPVGIAIADFTGNGSRDLAVASPTDSTVRVLLGNGDGTFQPQLTFPAGGQSRGITVADLNGDGFPDLATANFTSNNASTVLGGTVSPGQLTNIPVPGMGTQNVQSSFAPSENNYANSQSNIVPVVGSGIPTTTVVTSSLNPSSYLQLVALTATVTAPGGGSPTGTTDFTDNGATISGCSAVQLTPQQNGSTATCQTSSLTVGSHTIGVTYSGDQNFSGSSGTLIQTVTQPVGTTTTLSVSPSNASAGQVITLTASVASGGSPVSVGTAAFSSGTQVLGTVQLVRSGQAAGTATLKTRFSPGTYSLTAQFNGTADFELSTSTPQTLTVTGTEPTLSTLTATPDGSNYDFLLSVFGFGFPPPTGSATLNNLTQGGVLLGNIGLAAPGVPSYQAGTNFGAGAIPYLLTTGDFNGDGIPDLAVANGNTTGQTVNVMLGNGDGTFQSPQPYQVLTGPLGIASGDFNADGKLDLAVACFQPGNQGVSVLMGNGDGTFQAQQPYQVGTEPVAVAVGDFNGDGAPDLAVVDFAGSVIVLLNNGDGTFTPQQQTFPAGTEPTAIVVGDFNRDGNLDLAVAGHFSQVQVLLGNGDGTFQPATPFNTGNFPFGIAVGDLNNDGILDLAVTNSQDASVSVLLGNGDGSFNILAPIDLGAGPAGIVIADLNNDGFADLAISTGISNGDTVTVLLGNGDGTFQPLQQYPLPSGGQPIGLVTTDLNGDGVPDLAAASATQSAVAIFLGGTLTTGQLTNTPVFGSGNQNVQGTYTPNINFYTGSQSNIVPVVGSGIPTTTVVTSSLNPSTYLQPVTFTATVTDNGGSPTGTVNFTDGANTICSAVQLAPVQNGSIATCQTSSLIVGPHTIGATYSGDQNFTGSSGTLTQTVSPPVGTTTTLSVSPSNASAGQVVTLTATVASGGSPVTFGTATFSSGTQRLGTVQLLQSGQSAGTATLKTRFAAGTYMLTAQFNGTLSFQPSTSAPQALEVTGTEPTISTLTATLDGTNYDFSLSVFGFGFAPLAGSATLNNLTAGGTLLGTIPVSGPGLSSFQTQQTFSAGTNPFAVAVGDFNGDGIPDLAVVNYNGNNVSVLLGNGDGTFQPQTTYAAGTHPVQITAGDFNGDGNIDLAVTNNVDFTVSLLLGNGDGTFQPQMTFDAGQFPAGITTADFNGDGIPDLAVADSGSDNVVSVLLGVGNGTFQPLQTFGAGTTPIGIAVGDFNRDGIPDLAVTNNNGNNVSILLGNGDGTFQTQQTYAVGASPYGIVASDFRHNGTVDLAVTNLAGATLSVLLGNGDGTFQPQQTYTTGFSPYAVVVADLNGDGIPDLATANNSSDNTSVLLGNGDGTFQPQQTYAAGNGPRSIAAADLNGDGVPDLAMPNFVNDDNVSVLLGGTVSTGQLTNIPVPGMGNQNVQSTFTPSENNYAGSQSNVVPVVGTGGTTTMTVVTSSLNPSTYLQAVTFTATVTSSVGGSPTGTVNFTDGTNTICSAVQLVPIQNGSVATCMTSTLIAGTHNIVGIYSGDSDFAPSQSQPLRQVVNLAPTMNVMASSPNPSMSLQTVTISATITSPNGGSPTGTVNFTDNGVAIPGCTGIAMTPIMTGSVATCQTSTLTVGTHSQIRSHYSGDTNYLPCNGTLSPAQVVQAISTATALISSGSPSNLSQPVTFTATVTTPEDAPPASGFVTFQSNGVNIPDCINPAMVSNKIATCTTRSLAVGSDAIVATFNDPQGRFSSSSASLTQIVLGTTGDFTIQPISPASVTVTQSFTNITEPYFAQTIRVMAQPLNGYNNLVSLSCSVSPALTGGSCVVNSPASGSLAAGNLSTTLTISAGTATPVRNYTVTVTGQDNTGLMHTATLNLSVIDYTPPVNMPPGGGGPPIPVTFPGQPGTPISHFGCPLVTGTGLTGQQNFSVIGGVCTFTPTSGTIPGPITLTISGCTVARLRTQAPIYATFFLGIPGVVLLGSLRGNRRRRKLLLRLLGISLVAFALLIGGGCGGYGQLTPSGNYSVLVQATGSDGTVYSAVVPVTVTPLH